MLRLESVSMRYTNGHRALDRVDLDVTAGSITAVIGGSGCGKSTILRLVAGLEKPTSGTVSVGGEPVHGPSASVGFVFQEPRLMPWLTVTENVTFGIGDHRGGRAVAMASIALARVGLSDFAGTLPKQLSGGMAQRTALARALVCAPDVLLLDEPFSALDALTRTDLQQHLLDLWAVDHQTILIVTHDIDEALLLADEIVVMAGQPGQTVDCVPVAADRPRSLALPELVETRQRILAALSHTVENRQTARLQ